MSIVRPNNLAKVPRLLVVLLSLSAHAVADECGRPNLLDTFPPEHAVNVPTNATLTAHYAATAEYSNEPVTLERTGAATETLDATFDATQGLLQATPHELVAGSDYVVSWPALRGVGTASLGSSANIAFSVGTGPDTRTPTFDGLASVDWDVSRRHDACTGSIEERFVFDLTPGHVEDDFGRDELSLVVFQTRGPAMDPSSGPVPVLVAPLPSNGSAARVERSLADASGRVCFAALVQDVVGHASTGADREVCATTTPPPFFYGCRMAALGPASGAPSVGFVALLLSFLLRGRHRRAS